MAISDHHILFRDEIAGNSVLFENPSDILLAHSAEELEQTLNEVEKLRKQGKWLAGYLTYEAGYQLEPKLRPLMPKKRRAPLACFGVFDGPSPKDRRSGSNPKKRTYFGEPKAGWDFERYKRKFDTLINHLKMGDCYQANLTFPMLSKWSGDPFELFNRLGEIQPVGHAAYVQLAGPVILSRSPELFFRIEADRWIESRPMKGTAPRGKTPAQDAAIAEELKNDPKNRSENVMIVDLLRNDISRMSEAGSVHVPELYELQTFATLHQLISRVRGKLNPETRIIDIFRALFPCGSITGAPKIRAMEILHELEEQDARDVYCGAIGWVEPSGIMQFNVPIRTISLYENGTARFNVGGGIILGSTAESEYEECLVKAKFTEALAGMSR